MPTYHKRDGNHAEIQEAKRWAGCIPFDGADLGHGFPDGPYFDPHIWQWGVMEYKMPGGKLTRAEQKFFAMFPEGTIPIAHSMDEALEHIYRQRELWGDAVRELRERGLIPTLE